MKRFSFVKLVLLALVYMITFPVFSQNKQPNVIIVITDDQGYGDLNCLGNKVIQTPALDRFYNESVHLSNFHVSPTCAPTRSALMTGRYTDRLNCFHTIAGRSQLFKDETTIAQVFAQNGYKTAMFGKWHLGDNYPFRPEDRGFQEVVRIGGGGITQGPDYWGNDYFDDTYWHNSVPEQYKGYCTDVFFSNALNFIEKHKDESFFVYLATNAPHGPLFVPEKYYNIYKDEQSISESQKRFYGMITNIDDNFKLLENELERLRLKDNTIVIFMTDNGTATGIQYQDGKAFGYDGNMRGKKNSEYDGGHRVPFFIRWPESDINGKRDVNQLTAHIDVFPTLVDLCGLKFVPFKALDGTSLTPLLKGDNDNWNERSIVTDSQREQNLVEWRKSSVMDNTWRLVNGKELYNIKTDPKQTKDLATDYPDKVKLLRVTYEKWWQSIIDEGVNEKYAYIQVGTPYENPTRISAHDLHTGFWGHIWHQYGALEAAPGSGVFKIDFTTAGTYKISLCRYPRASGLAFNEVFPGIKPTLEVNDPMPPSNNVNMQKAVLYLGDYEGLMKKIMQGDKEETFTVYMQKGKYDMETRLYDAENHIYPAYYVYIEKID
ncbi:sulfatase-like hydrolase/transferase [Maribellus comscasis]|uniref:Sulfatase-like hydrolase/transferase n=1 Tax=Maribellus comscasis TaxID=2681766 RepID=A0A6I6JN62_9BACT|nr:arylsulfatase [Maribellus comscasis]QGY42539.1 sulfatase-like hydrolase/transferase [Maribellus comscasis]